MHRINKASDKRRSDRHSDDLENHGSLASVLFAMSHRYHETYNPQKLTDTCNVLIFSCTKIKVDEVCCVVDLFLLNIILSNSFASRQDTVVTLQSDSTLEVRAFRGLRKVKYPS